MLDGVFMKSKDNFYNYISGRSRVECEMSLLK